MAEELKKRNEMNPEFQWDLSSLYKSDEEWEKDLTVLDDDVKKVAKYRGKLSSAEKIRKYLDESTDLDRKISDLFDYAELKKNADSQDSSAQDMYSRIYAKYVHAAAELSFADPEILSLSEEVLAAITNEPILSDYSRTMTKLLRRKTHMLSCEEEKLIARFGEVLALPGEVESNLQDADLVFDMAKDKDGNEIPVSESNYILLQSSNDRIMRENSFHSFYKEYQKHENTFAAVYAGQVKAATAMAEVRHYNSSCEMYMDSEHIPTEVYDNLIETVHKFMPEMYRYVALRKKLLQVDTLHYYDIYAPLAAGIKKEYTYEEAKKTVLDAVKPLGTKYTDIMNKGFDEKWIDVYPNKGKHSGAFSSGTYDSVPYVLTNFVGDLESVSTIAHEMGHSIHSWFSNHNQPPQDADYTIFVAEVASTVNENLLIEKLLRDNFEKLDSVKADPEKMKEVKAERLSLLNHYLEGFKGTVYRQTMFAEFEKLAHEAVQNGESLNASKLSHIYEDLIKEYFGNELAVDDEVKLEWSRIPHFYTPFYVYKYATSYSAAVAISEKILEEESKLIGTKSDVSEANPAVKKYLEFLSMGDSMDPLDELLHAGVDLRTSAPIEAALDKFHYVLDEVEDLVK